MMWCDGDVCVCVSERETEGSVSGNGSCLHASYAYGVCGGNSLALNS